MTGTRPEIWVSNTENCIEMINNRFESLVILGSCVVYSLILWKTISGCTDVIFGFFSRRKTHCAIVLAEDVLKNPNRAYISVN